ncbi:FecR domain-containing protein [Acidovorax sp. Root267]|uniref:FecR family protein n=1 Tax=Acidovorax sp. Root267 TaxID=1736505 RepID=UPI0009EAA081|nr:FecR domain-containing protein [Acidovorax sp. Root267]
MNPPSPAHLSSSPSPAPVGADVDAREFADFLSGQNLLDVEAASWQVRRQDGLTVDEEAEFQQWLARDPLHQDSFDRLDGVWDRLDRLSSEGIVRLKAGLTAEEGNFADGPSTPHTRPQATQPSRPVARPMAPGRSAWLFGIGRWVPQIAAGGVAFAVMGGGWLGWDHWQQQPVFTKTYVTARGQQLDVQLPDGSRLSLDTATRAEVTLYRERREVRLPEGQALFNVQADARRPFDVLAGPLRVSVVGTRFVVRNTKTGLSLGGASVAVEEGRVRVEAAQAGAHPHSGKSVDPTGAVELAAGQAIHADAAGRIGQITQQAAAGAMLWREGRVNFERTPLIQALAEFERYGSTRLVVNDPAVGAMQVHGSFDLRQLGAFTKALPQVLPVRLEIHDGVTEVLAAH